MWAYFDDIGRTARCKLCSREFVRQSGTTNLFAHLSSAHKEQHAAAVGGKPPVSAENKRIDVQTCADTKPISN